MGLETFNYIDSLNASNPVGASDQVAAGDDHIRGIKTTLLNSLPGITGAVTSTHTELNYLDGLTGVTGSGNLVASASPTLTGTITAAAANLSGALTALSYGGITEANLVDKSASETISGATWDFQAITAVSFGGIASANLVDKSAAETITGTWSLTAVAAAGASIDFGSAAITSDNDTADEPGYKGTPQLSKSASYELALADTANQVYLAGGTGQTLTIPANASVAFPVGTVFIVINDSGNDWTIAITSDTLEKYGGGTGSQTLSDNNKAILEKVGATTWKYSATD